MESIDEIKRRMILNASRYWGYRDLQDIDSFDPILGLIIGSLAEEIHTISNELEESDSRIVNKLLDVLYREKISAHHLANAIACASPLHTRIDINEFYQFFFTKKIETGEITNQRESENAVYFTPTSNIALLKAEIRYLAYDKYLLKSEGGFNSVFQSTTPQNSIEKSKLFLGIQVDPYLKLLDGLTLYFSFKSLSKKDHFYHLLHAASWKINGKKVRFHNSIGKVPEMKEDRLKSISERRMNGLSLNACNHVNDFYLEKFMTLTYDNYEVSNFSPNNSHTPLHCYFGVEIGDAIPEEIIWIEIDFQQHIDSEELNDLFISLNCFPVINREFNEFTSTISRGSNTISLPTDYIFFDIHKISDTNNTTYVSVNSLDLMNANKHTYLLRQGGVARIDSRDTKEYLKRLLDLLRDDASAFSSFGEDVISQELQQINQLITRLQQRIDTSSVSNKPNTYLILESTSEHEKILVQFWSVSGELANRIRSGTTLQVQSGYGLDVKSVKLITSTMGGKHSLTENEKMNKLRREILSKGRIVSVEDVKALCYDLFGENIKSVNLCKGLSRDVDPKKGVSRTMDIYIKKSSGFELADEELNYKKEVLLHELKQKSMNLLPYRIIVENP